MALQERDAWVAECEQRAGEALVQLVDGEGLTTTEAVRWCVGEVSVPEAARLRRLVKSAGADDAPAAPPVAADGAARDGTRSVSRGWLACRRRWPCGRARRTGAGRGGAVTRPGRGVR